MVSEIRFPENFPLSPPFVRIVYPRFLPFIRGELVLSLVLFPLTDFTGGGGHVTGGGSICHELLTSNGWSPAYAIESVLLQIRMAMQVISLSLFALSDTGWYSSNLEPRPARLDPQSWSLPYTMNEGESSPPLLLLDTDPSFGSC